jgi:predicted O-methyltransferase YrrM
METKLEVDISIALETPGWATESELLWLAEQSANLKPDSRVIEIGTFLGRSALAIACNLEPEESRLVCVDPYVDYGDPLMGPQPWEDIFGIAKETLAGYASLLREPSSRAAIRFHDHTIDMIFIDGDHSYSAVLADITAWERTIKPGGLICGHDYGVHPGVKQAVDESFSYGRIKFPAGSIWAVRK